MKKLLKIFWREQLMILLIMAVVAGGQTVASLQNVAVLNGLIQADLRLFLRGVIGMLTAYSVFLAGTYLQIRYLSATMQKMSQYLRQKLLTHVSQQDPLTLQQQSTGSYVSSLSNDLTMIESQAFSNFYQVIQGLLSSVFALIALLQFHWSLLLLTLVQTGLLILLPKLFQNKMQQAAIDVAKANERFLQKATELFNGFTTFANFQRLTFWRQQILASGEAIKVAKNHQQKQLAGIAIAGGAGNVIGQISVLALTGYLALLKLVSVGTITATGNLASTIFNTLGNISQYIGGIQGALPLFEKFEHVETQPELPTVAFPSAPGYHLQQVRYGYDKPLFDLSLSFEPQKKYAIVGASGSGKSTLFHLLSGQLTDYQGELRFGGHEMKKISFQQLQEKIAYIQQEPYLFSGTIMENLTLGRDFTPAEIDAALEKAALTKVIADLPAGLATLLGEKGQKLSGGQKQRLTLARGFLWQKPVFLIDEGTSSLDTANAKQIEDLLLQQDALVIFITHHLRPELAEQLDAIVTLGT